MDTKPALDLTFGETYTFGQTGMLRKAFRSLPDGVFVGADVQLGHWSAEVASIQPRGDELQQGFVVGFRMRFRGGPRMFAVKNPIYSKPVIAAAIGLFEISDLRRIYRIQRWEFWLSIACFVGVVLFGAIPGIGIAVAIAIIEFLWDGWRPHSAVLGRVDGIKGYHDIGRYPQAHRVTGLVLFRWDAPLFFANANLFRERVVDLVDEAAAPVRWVIVAAEPITDVDTTAAESIQELDTELGARGVELAFAEMKDPVKDRLQRYGLKARIGQDFFFPTVGAGVKAYLAQTGIEWVDWEEGSKSVRDGGASPTLRPDAR